MENESVFKKCEKCGAIVKIIKDCNCENCGIQCCGEAMKIISQNSAEAEINKHAHAIIIIKNEKNEFLQYYDERWNSFLFLNCKLKSNFDISNIIEYSSNKLKISIDELNCNYITDKIHKKFSESAKKEKEYHHYFYYINIKNMPQIMQQKEFLIDNIKYTWYSFKELENDERIQQVNSDIISFVKEFEAISKNN
ncbi:MAG: hypothetical protein J6A89_05250 [Clostridia bacterium]|nr:hypothetical protein [Clostridia bacterium]